MKKDYLKRKLTIENQQIQPIQGRKMVIGNISIELLVWRQEVFDHFIEFAQFLLTLQD